MSPILGIYASQISGHLYNNSYTSLQTVTVGSGGASSITFSSIPSTYTHLQLRILAKGTSALGGYPTSGNIALNGDSTSSNYANHSLSGNGSAASASAATSNTGNIFVTAGSSGSWSSSIFTTSIIDILDYSNTNKYKTLRSLQGGDNNGAGTIVLTSMLWQSTSAISSISFTADPTYLTTFAQYSQFALYGVN